MVVVGRAEAYRRRAPYQKLPAIREKANFIVRQTLGTVNLPFFLY
jgi:hypothetical protein